MSRVSLAHFTKLVPIPSEEYKAASSQSLPRRNQHPSTLDADGGAAVKFS